MKKVMWIMLLFVVALSFGMNGCASSSGKVAQSTVGCSEAPPPVVVKAPTAAVAAAVPVIADRKEIIYFDFDKSNYIASEQAKIDKIVGWMKADAKSKAIVIGYTDPIGTDQYNIGLSKRRAEAVKAALVKAGIPVDKISVEYKGETNLAIPGKKSIKDNAPNRRAEVTVTVK